MRTLKSAVNRNKQKKKLFRAAKGFHGARGKHYKMVIQSVKRAEKHAFAGRKQKKRDMRRLWVTRLNIASRALGLPYSRLIAGLQRADVRLDRKQLSEMAIHQPEAFAEVVEQAKAALAE